MRGAPPGREGGSESGVRQVHRLASARRPPAAVGALRQGLSVQLGGSVVRQLEALMMVSTETPVWWAAALPPSPAFTAAGNPQ